MYLNKVNRGGSKQKRQSKMQSTSTRPNSRGSQTIKVEDGKQAPPTSVNPQATSTMSNNPFKARGSLGDTQSEFNQTMTGTSKEEYYAKNKAIFDRIHVIPNVF